DSRNITNLFYGMYEVKVTDANGCIAYGTSTVRQPNKLNVSYHSQKTSCKNTNDGQIEILVTGGEAPYSFKWLSRPGLNDFKAVDLAAGSYSVIITDANNCTYQLNNPLVEANLCPPAAENDNIQTEEDTPIVVEVLKNDSDPDGSLMPATVIIVSPPSHGSVKVNQDGTVVYTPHKDYHGNDSFTYTIKDDDGLISNIGQVAVKVIPVNDPPTAIDDVFKTEQDVILNGCVCPNDSDPDGDPLTFSVVEQPGHGTLAFAAQNGSFTYKPAAGFVGVDKFLYQACDPSGACDTALVTIHVIPTSIVNLTPSVTFISE